MNASDSSLALPLVDPVALVANKTIRKKVQDGIVAVSLANLWLVRASFRLLYSANKGYFDEVGTTLPKLLALVLNLLLLTSVAWLGLRAWRRWRSQWPSVAIEFLFFLSLLLPLDFVRFNMLEIADSTLLAYLKRPLADAGLMSFLVFLLWQRRRVARGMTIVTGVLSPLAVFALLRFCVLAIHLSESPAHPLVQAGAPLLPTRQDQPRVVWVIFDETDQRLAFDQRPPTLKLPEFDRLRSQSICATNARSPGNSTRISMPALISGRLIESMAILDSSDLLLTEAVTGAKSKWSDLPSVFSSARELGFNSAVVGWYHPYSRVLGTHLSFCSWYSILGSEHGLDMSVPALMKRQLLRCSVGPFYGRQVFIDLCRSSLQDSILTITNVNYGLILLHLPPPHKPGVYRPETDSFTFWGMPKTMAYFNNLALADHQLGILRRAMETSGLWDKTWLLMSADHSWRESAAYDGQQDSRVPFVLKAPGRNLGLTCSTRFNTVLTHDLILEILSGKAASQEQAFTWIQQHGCTTPTIIGKDED